MNHQPELLLAPVVKQGLYDWLLWALEEPRLLWPYNAQETTPEEEWLEVARTGTILTSDKRAVQAWAALSDLRLQQRLDEWFDGAYEEVTE